MIPFRRRRQVWTVVRIVLLTALALVMERARTLTVIENDLDDLRIQYCQLHLTKPTEQLVHLDIDETALDQIGRWPWDRDELADLLEEVRLAGPKVVALDIILPDASKPKYDDQGKKTDPDAVLADEIKKLNCVLLPASLMFENNIAPDPIDAQLTTILAADPELSVEQCHNALARQGVAAASMRDVERRCLIVRPQAIYDRIEREMNAGHGAKADLQKILLPHYDPISARSVDHLFDEQFERAARDRLFERFTMSPGGRLPPVLSADEALTPLANLSKSARYGAFVDYLPDHVGGIVRVVPLLAAFRGKLVPHMGLAVACAMMDVDVNDLRVSRDSVIIPRKGMSDIVIPVHSRETPDFGEIGLFMGIPMFGKKDGWETMYDFPSYQERAQHVSMYEPWQAVRTRRQIAANDAEADNALVRALALTNPSAAGNYQKSPLTGDARQALILSTFTTISEMAKGVQKDNPNPDDDTKELLNNLNRSVAEILAVGRQRNALDRQLAAFREDLRSKLKDRAVFIGSIATGDVDVVPTTLDAHCPGVVVHGAIFNGIMNRRMWRTVPPYVNYLIILAFGLVTGLLVAKLPPLRAFAAVLAMCLCYLAFNGFYLFDQHNLIVGMSGPLLTAILVWSGITVPNFITEIKERNRITRRFSNYVDPSLVNYVIEHPEQAHFDGEAREMTMGFTDLAGFTTLTESLGPRIILLLNEYIGKMVPIIRNNQGYVSRLMGDGIYFFFNAPGHDPAHAMHAVTTALQMHAAVDEMNLTLPARNYPLLGLRAGICTGTVIVGDAGARELFSDYTAMGDAVNTAARLETANKNFSTRTLIIERTVELLERQYLCRPIANLRVAGKTRGVMVYEPICRTEQATPAQKQLVELSTEIVGKFQAADFTGCIEVACRLETAFGESKFSSLYKKLSEEYLISAPADFNGQVILTEK